MLHLLAENSKVYSPPNRASQPSLPLTWRSRASYQTFHLDRCHEKAMAWIQAFPRWPFRVLFIYGPSGSGKTHLANIFWEKTGGCWISPYLSHETLRDLLAQPFNAFILDDLHSCLEQAHRDLFLFSLYEGSQEHAKKLLILSRDSPQNLKSCPQDIRSRFSQEEVVSLSLPDDELLINILKKQLEDVNIPLPLSTAKFLKARMDRSFPGIQNLSQKVMDHLFHRPGAFTIPVAKQVLDQINHETLTSPVKGPKGL